MKKLLDTVFSRLKAAGLLSLTLAGSCITPYNSEVQTIGRALVVEGMITDRPGPYTVRLSRTADYNYNGLNLLEPQARVTLSDNAGHQEVLTETEYGVYQTRAGGIQGQAGRTYKISIRTRDGKTYESSTELLKAAPPIQKLYYEYQFHPLEFTNDKKNTWEVYLDSRDPETPGDYYRWKWTHYEQAIACFLNPDADMLTGFFMGVPCCGNCWDISQCYSNCITISSDATVNGKAFTRQYILSVPYTSTSTYYVEVEQQLISAGAYRFFKSVDKLVNNSGGLFDSAPAAVGGNLKSLSNPGEPVYGYFGAAGIAEMALKVDRTRDAVGLPFGKKISLFPGARCTPCVESQYRTQVEPRWWNQ
ncbi:DUF4249 domain-containing protein [Larkinella soli]|uniref:DUF4249 domain-containing protein n=1 Tax=Larkinella soli TaxID=1770527 RepID=UPI000FFC7EA4|nr:DUF4249 domain-containing protein [Larkinella soli]